MSLERDARLCGGTRTVRYRDGACSDSSLPEAAIVAATLEFSRAVRASLLLLSCLVTSVSVGQARKTLVE
jgi:hypothetical protein